MSRRRRRLKLCTSLTLQLRSQIRSWPSESVAAAIITQLVLLNRTVLFHYTTSGRVEQNTHFAVPPERQNVALHTPKCHLLSLILFPLIALRGPRLILHPSSNDPVCPGRILLSYILTLPDRTNISAKAI